MVLSGRLGLIGFGKLSFDEAGTVALGNTRTGRVGQARCHVVRWGRVWPY